MSDRETTGFRINSVHKAIKVLEQLASSSDGLTAREVSVACRLNRVTCYHLLQSLADFGYARYNAERGRFSLGGRIAWLYHEYAARVSPLPGLQPLLRRLAAQTRETCYLVLHQDDTDVLADIVESDQAVRVRSLPLGFGGYRHARAAGKSLLAFSPEAAVREYLRKFDMQVFTPATITDPDRLISELREVARSGVAFDRGEFDLGTICLSTAVFGADGALVGAFSVAMPAQRATAQTVDSCRQHVLEAAVEGSRMFGYGGAYPPLSPMLRSEDETLPTG